MPYEPRPTPGGPRAGASTRTNPLIPDNVDWQNAFMDWVAWKWADPNTDKSTFLGNTWNTAQFGDLDPAELITDPKTGAQEVALTPRTALAFRKYASSYQGNDPEVNAGVAWIPPKPGDRQEDPATIVARTQVEQWEKTYNRQLANDERLAKTQEMANEISREDIAARERMNSADIAARLRAAGISAEADIFGTKTRGATDIYGTQGNIYGSQLGALSSIFGTQGNMYNAQLGNQADIYGVLAQFQATQDSLRRAGLSDAAATSIALQGLKDARVENLIGLKANPGNWVEAEYAARALGSPQGTDQPLYGETGGVQELIDKLANFQGGQAPTPPSWYGQNPTQPVAPILPTAPGAPTLPSAPNINTTSNTPGALTSSQTPPASQPSPSQQPIGPTGPAPGQGPPPPTNTTVIPGLSSDPNRYRPEVMQPPPSNYNNQMATPQWHGNVGDPNDPRQSPIDWYANQVPSFAMGGMTNAPRMMVGDT